MAMAMATTAAAAAAAAEAAAAAAEPAALLREGLARPQQEQSGRHQATHRCSHGRTSLDTLAWSGRSGPPAGGWGISIINPASVREARG